MSLTTLQRLLNNPHAAVFDKAPDAELAFRLQHPDRARWLIAERVLTATGGEVEHTYDLRQFSVAGLVGALVADGFVVTSANQKFSALSACVLVEGRGDEYESDGDHVMAFQSLLWALMSAYAEEVIAARGQVGEALRQMVMLTAEAEWLDFWGTLYSVPRLPGESDAAYQVRIPKEAFRLRNNARAIELAIRDATGFDVRIEEPWVNIFRLDQSLLSGSDKFYDGETVGYHLIKPTARTQIDWPAVKAVIDRNRAAGVILLGPEIEYQSFVDAGNAGIVYGGLDRDLSEFVPYQDKALLDYMDIGDVSVPNFAALRQKEILRTSTSTSSGRNWETEVPWLEIPWSTDYYVFSEQVRDYRVHYLALSYSSARWADLAGKTWADLSGETWAGVSTVIHSEHTRSS